MTFDPNDHMMTLPGKNGPRQYLQVAHRLLWLRSDAPESNIETELMRMDGEGAMERAIFRARVHVRRDGQDVCTTTGWGSETRSDFGDFLEKAETKAVGRALAAAGYGTQFAPDLDEGDRIVDAPQNQWGGKYPNDNSGGYNNQRAPQGQRGGQQQQRTPDSERVVGGATKKQMWAIKGAAKDSGYHGFEQIDYIISSNDRLEDDFIETPLAAIIAEHNGGDFDPRNLDVPSASAIIKRLQS